MLVRVNNGEQLDVMPLVGDFNFYGGIYRDVHLLVTEDICISPLDYASPGVYLFSSMWVRNKPLFWLVLTCRTERTSPAGNS